MRLKKAATKAQPSIKLRWGNKVCGPMAELTTAQTLPTELMKGQAVKSAGSDYGQPIEGRDKLTVRLGSTVELLRHSYATACLGSSPPPMELGLR